MDPNNQGANNQGANNQGANNQGDREAVSADANEALLDKAEALIWALLDDEIDTADIKQLEQLLQGHQTVRDRYIQCVQMHVDLHGHFGGLPAVPELPERPKSPVLGSLGDLRPGTDTLPPVPPVGE